MTGASLLASAVALSGCVVFKSEPTAKQSHVIGPVTIAVEVCASQGGTSPPKGSCDRFGNSGLGSGSALSQVFLGFRVPKGAAAPHSFAGIVAPHRGRITLRFRPSKSYTSQLQTLDPHRGEQWVGYASQYFYYDAYAGPQEFTAEIPFGLPAHANGAPFAGPFTYRAVVGARKSFNGPHANKPINCHGNLTQGYQTRHADYICVDDPSSTTLDTDDSLPTRDAGIVAGEAVKASPGHSAIAHFKFDYAGMAAGAAHFKLRASTSLPGASAKPSVTTLTPKSNSTKAVTVSVNVPAGAHSGRYAVTLIATVSGQTRTGTVTLTVS